MELKFKYWGNSGGNLYVQDFHCETYCDLRNAVANLIADRPDIDNIEVYMGRKIVVALYNIKLNILGRGHDIRKRKKICLVP
jgi:hypothetical protein